MKVVLRADVPDVGTRGDVVEVADGFGRNFLLARGLGIAASKGAIAQAETMKRASAKRDQRDRENAARVSGLLTAKAIRIPARAGEDGRLFGSVTAIAIAEAVEAQTGVEIDRRKLVLDEPIRSLGVHSVVIKLHSTVETTLTLEVVVQ